jgi:hypothetical protein
MCIIINVACFANAYGNCNKITESLFSENGGILLLSKLSEKSFSAFLHQAGKQFTTLITNFKKQGVLLMT